MPRLVEIILDEKTTVPRLEALDVVMQKGTTGIIRAYCKKEELTFDHVGIRLKAKVRRFKKSTGERTEIEGIISIPTYCILAMLEFDDGDVEEKTKIGFHQ